MSSRTPLHWKHRTKFNLEEESAIAQYKYYLPTSIPYHPCDCQGRYSFKERSPLLPYLQKSEGWVNDIEGKYTLNYIIINLFAIIKSKGLFVLDEETQTFLHFKPDLELQKALELWDDSLFNVRDVRQLIGNFHLEGHKDIYVFRTPPFACTNKIGKRTRKLILSILGKPPHIGWFIANHSV